MSEDQHSRGWLGDQIRSQGIASCEELAADPSGTASKVLDWLRLKVPKERQLVTTRTSAESVTGSDWDDPLDQYPTWSLLYYSVEIGRAHV